MCEEQERVKINVVEEALLTQVTINGMFLPICH